jgi:hypothetical protein
VARDEADKKTKQLSLAIHCMIYDDQLLLHLDNEGLRAAPKIKQKCKQKPKPFEPREKDLVHGGAMWWSPRSVEAEKHRLEQEGMDDQQQKQQKQDDIKVHKFARNPRAALVAEGKAKEAEERLQKWREKEAENAAKIQKKKEDAAAKAATRTKPHDKKKPASKAGVKKKQRGGGRGGALSGGPASAPLPPPPLLQSGRHINPPKRYHILSQNALEL